MIWFFQYKIQIFFNIGLINPYVFLVVLSHSISDYKECVLEGNISKNYDIYENNKLHFKVQKKLRFLIKTNV